MVLELFNMLNPEVMILGLLFIIFFALIQVLLSRSLKDRNSASIIAFCVSLLAVYGISRTGFDVSGLVYRIGINSSAAENIFYSILPFIILGGLIFIFWKVKMRVILTLTGLILMIASRFVYEKGIVLGIGILLLCIGLYLIYKESRRKVQKGIYLRK